MTWAGRRKATYTVVFLILILGIVGFAGYKLFYNPPTCFDGIQNQTERGIDCSGPCEKLCAADFIAPRIYWERVVPVTTGVYTVLAYGENVNPNAFLPAAQYKIRLYDQDGILIASREGIVDISPASRFAIFEPNIETGVRVPTRALVEMAEVLPWQKTTEENWRVSASEYRLENASTSPRLVVDVRNNDLKSHGPMTATAILYNTNDVAFAFSQTLIDGIEGAGEQTLVYTWPYPITQEVGRVEIVFVRDWQIY